MKAGNPESQTRDFLKIILTRKKAFEEDENRLNSFLGKLAFVIRRTLHHGIALVKVPS